MRALRIVLFMQVLILTSAALGQGDQGRSGKPDPLIAEQANRLMQECERSIKAKRLDQAEVQCRAAIQLLKEGGWRPQGETFTLGMIIAEKGQRREGFNVMVN